MADNALSLEQFNTQMTEYVCLCMLDSVVDDNNRVKP